MLRFLKSRGNFLHNAHVSSNGTGEMVACRRPSETKAVSDFKHCIYCQGLYAKESLWRHVRYCFKKPKEKDLIVGRKRVQSLPYMILPPPDNITQAVWNIACEMNNDDISSVVRSERYILLLGQQLYNKSKSRAGRNDYIRQKMREVARLVIKARSISPLEHIEDFIMPCNFNYVVDAVRAVAGYNENSNLYGIASLAVKLGHSLKKVANIIECNALMLGNAKMAKSAQNFSTLYEKQWNESISATALHSLNQAKWNKPKVLPFTEDIKKLHFFLASKHKECMKALREEPSPTTYASLSKVTLNQVILFNRRREGEVSNMLMKSYISKDKTKMHEDIAVGLSSFEKKLCEYFQRVEICGKRGRKVPILLAPDMIAAMDLLVEKRTECKVPSKNQYMFARPYALTHFRGGDCFRKYGKACGARNPGALTSTKLRMQISTLSTILNLKENEMDQLANFLGHDIRVHREYYRLPESTLQLAKMSKLLIAMQKGSLPMMQGKGLDEIIINPEDDLDVSSGSSDEESFDLLHDLNGSKQTRCEEDCADSTQQQPMSHSRQKLSEVLLFSQGFGVDQG
ncbi:hypothetical protein UPYG_G00236930 [Umbra pygmaea]|uniref:Uncharacterized protein n=1 Tax=Umbra pygmaea TaxID=75934 RepID=A0ABD0WJJ4_UMBPY